MTAVVDGDKLGYPLQLGAIAAFGSSSGQLASLLLRDVGVFLSLRAVGWSGGATEVEEQELLCCTGRCIVVFLASR